VELAQQVAVTSNTYNNVWIKPEICVYTWRPEQIFIVQIRDVGFQNCEPYHLVQVHVWRISKMDIARSGG